MSTRIRQSGASSDANGPTPEEPTAMAITSQEELDFEKLLVDHKSHSEMQRANIAAAFTYVVEATKAAFLLNGATAIALMTFAGAQRPGGWPALAFGAPLRLFAIGAALAVVTLGVAYISQAYFADMNAQRRQRSRPAEWSRNVALGTFTGSVATFLIGLWYAAAKL
jgi:hypothetical protein